ncbi:MAG: hypothetical protein WBG71_02020 [Leeuwenhoekiella sp.]
MRGTKKIDWLNHFLEFIVVIIGILIAFQLNTCSQENKEQELVDQHIENILEETRYNKDNVTYFISQSDAMIAKADSLLILLNDFENPKKVNQFALELMNLPYSYIKRNAYNSLIQSGDIRLIKDFKVKDDIINLYEYYDWAEGMNKATEETYSNFLYPYVVKNLDLRMGTVQSQEVYQNKEFSNIISAYSYILKAGKLQHQESAQKMEDFLASYSEETTP